MSEVGAVEAAAIRRKVAAGAAFMIGGRVFMRGVSVASTLILARLLVPEDFGLVALAASIFLVVDILSSTNFGAVLVRRHEVERSHYDTAWTMNLIRCLGLGAVVALTAEWQADFLGDARLAPILLIIALNVALDGFGTVGFARLTREFRFDLMFRHQVVTRLVSFVVTVALAAVWESYWSLVLGNTLAKIVSIPYGYYLAPHRPRLNLDHWREFFSFSKWTLAINACVIADGQGPNLVLGRVMGAGAVGMYNIAYQVAATPVTEIAVPIRGPIYAGYARVQHDLALLSREFLDGFGYLFTLVIPLSVGIALVSPELERIALGPAWAGVAPLMAICALYAMADAMAHFTFNLFTVLDRLGRFTTVYVAVVLLRVPAVIFGTLWYGAEGAVLAMLVTGVVNALIWHVQVGRLLGHRLADVLVRLVRPAAAAIAMTAAVLAMRSVLPPGPWDMLGALRNLAILSLTGAVAHVSVGLLLWRLAGSPPGPERHVLDLLARLVARRPGPVVQPP